jgi:uncharacterized protein YoxC
VEAIIEVVIRESVSAAILVVFVLVVNKQVTSLMASANKQFEEVLRVVSVHLETTNRLLEMCIKKQAASDGISKYFEEHQ